MRSAKVVLAMANACFFIYIVIALCEETWILCQCRTPSTRSVSGILETEGCSRCPRNKILFVGWEKPLEAVGRDAGNAIMSRIEREQGFKE